ncbi:four helix bundle protein [Lysinibacillus sp. NPDC096212]|uniref:four helix bundle protein n=1 Tax=Lysinibacillus sp. NPDC096212 TaxID=3364135 RepID=UPI003808E38D
MENTKEIKIKNPRSLTVYKKCMELNGMIYKLVKQFPIEEKYRMESQIIRSCTSIGANLAEGNGQIYNAKELSFLNNSLGSAQETVYWLDVAIMKSYISSEQFKIAEGLTQEIMRMLIGMMKKLKSEEVV